MNVKLFFTGDKILENVSVLGANIFDIFSSADFFFPSSFLIQIKFSFKFYVLITFDTFV